MNVIKTAKTKLLLALVEVNDQCKKQGQNGLIGAIIAECIAETTEKKTIGFVIQDLYDKKYKNNTISNENTR